MLDAGKIRFSEKHTHDYGLFIDSEEILYSRRSKYQLVEVLKTDTWGNLLLLDRNIMTTERDEFIYHEVITQIGMHTTDAKRVLVIGGGDGGTIRELLKHDKIEKVVLVEIDEDVIEVCKEYFPKIACSFDDPRLDLKVEDGIRYVNGSREKFDMVIIDSSDPFGPAEGLFKAEFYQACKKLLTEDGVLLCQAGNAFMTDESVIAYSNLAEVFKNIEYFLAPILTYGGLWGFVYASDTRYSQRDFDEKYFDKTSQKMNFKYYNKEIHQAVFALPPFMKKKLKGELVETD